MKKVITILTIAIVLVGAVFATTTSHENSLVLSANVAKIDPVFVLRDSSATGQAGVTTGTAPVIATGRDLAYQDIEWTFYVTQEGEVNGGNQSVTHSKYNGNITLSLTLGSFTGVDTNTVAAGTPVVQSANASAVETENNGKFTITADTTNKTLVLAYTGKNVNDQTIGYFECKWTKDPTLPIDTYKATVTLCYTTEN